MRISDWSSDVCSSDLLAGHVVRACQSAIFPHFDAAAEHARRIAADDRMRRNIIRHHRSGGDDRAIANRHARHDDAASADEAMPPDPHRPVLSRSEAHTSELQSIMRSPSAVFSFIKKKKTKRIY